MKHETRYNEDKKIKPHFLLQSEWKGGKKNIKKRIKKTHTQSLECDIYDLFRQN
jgi:hypothetical protein